MTEQPTPIKAERIISVQEQLDYVAKKITDKLPESLKGGNGTFVLDMWNTFIPQIIKAPDQATIDRKFGFVITKLGLESDPAGKEELLEELAGLQDMLTDPDYANDEKAQQEIRKDIAKLEEKIDRNQDFFGNDFEKVRDDILDAREKFQNGTLVQEIPELAPVVMKEEEPEIIIETPTDIAPPARTVYDDASLIRAEKQTEPAENSDSTSETLEEVIEEVSQESTSDSQETEAKEDFDPKVFSDPFDDGVQHSEAFASEEFPQKEEAPLPTRVLDLSAAEHLAHMSSQSGSLGQMVRVFRDDYNADSHPEIPDARITLGDTAFTIRDSNKNEITLQSVDDETIVHKIDRKKFEKIREAMKLQASLEGSPKGTLAITDEQKKLKNILESLFEEGAPITNTEVATPADKAAEQPEEKIEPEPKVDTLDHRPETVAVEKITDRASLAEIITTGYEQEILDLYTTRYDKVLDSEVIIEFNQNKALELMQEIIARYHLPITKITTLEDNIYEMHITLANGVVLEHVGSVTSGATLVKKATLVTIARTILDALSDDEVAEILAKIKSGQKNTNVPEIVVVRYVPKVTTGELAVEGKIEAAGENLIETEMLTPKEEAPVKEEFSRSPIVNIEDFLDLLEEPRKETITNIEDFLDLLE
ncbi:MAG: hypothetical protein KBC22_00500 [Candidatus Pacebacteria bacterium]|nr:hypothetical protein [Candidatus Paceibacterota bacterium]